ncbi:MAG: type II toxin-antitoxin system RelE/ParE family toxin [Lautropia sp.]|nr:type II toxin-antitoxin system RelE/ParE family toxin [Lautropia sp.]
MAYVLTDEAESDLREIIRYTRRTWGEAQTRRYMTQLKQCIASAVVAKDRARRLGDIHPDLRMARCDQHHVFFLTGESTPLLVVAILHGRMDLMTRLKDRLGLD